jgi:hypothetical protein
MYEGCATTCEDEDEEQPPAGMTLWWVCSENLARAADERAAALRGIIIDSGRTVGTTDAGDSTVIGSEISARGVMTSGVVAAGLFLITGTLDGTVKNAEVRLASSGSEMHKSSSSLSSSSLTKRGCTMSAVGSVSFLVAARLTGEQEGDITARSADLSLAASFKLV